MIQLKVSPSSDIDELRAVWPSLKEYQKAWFAGDNCKEWLEKWDADGVVTIQMGGISTGYERTLQACAAGFLRALVEKRVPVSAMETRDEWKTVTDEVEEEVFPELDKWGLSGSQVGAAWNLAAVLYKQGPVGALNMMKDLDRVVLVMNPDVHGLGE